MKYPEGATPLDPDEMGGLKFKHITTRGELDQLEQGNIQIGLGWLSRIRIKDILSEEFVRELRFSQVLNYPLQKDLSFLQAFAEKPAVRISYFKSQIGEIASEDLVQYLCFFYGHIKLHRSYTPFVFDI